MDAEGAAARVTAKAAPTLPVIPSAAPSEAYVPAFDGVRGVLALGVVLSHFTLMTVNPFDDPTRPLAVWEHLCWYLGAPAVDAFFVLSGWVVAGSYLRHRSVWTFYLARLRRLYPLALLGALLGLLVARPLMSLIPTSATEHGLLAYLRLPLSGPDVWGSLSMGLLGEYRAARISPPLWSLAVEVYASLLTPLLVLGTRRWGWAALWVSLPVCLALSSVFTAFVYLPLFLLGTLLVLAPLPGMTPRTRQAARGMALFGGALLFSRHLTGVNHDLMRWGAAVGAALLLLGLRGLDPAWLWSRAAQWLGQRSYALYATHFPVLMVGFAFLSPVLGPAWSAAALVPAALLVADLAQRGADRLSGAWKSRRGERIG